MDSKVLTEFGLTKIEAEVYLSLLELGNACSAGKVIKRAGLHKATVYSVLEKLIEKGLASYILQGNMRFFSATDPERLAELLKEKQELLSSILPELKRKKGAVALENEAAIYESVKGIKSVLELMLNELNPKGEYLDFGVSGLFKEAMGAYWFAWQNKKKKFKIKSKCIFDESVRQNKELLQNYIGDAKFLESRYYSAVDTMIFNSKVVMFVWNAKPPFAVLIKSKDIADSYRSQFNALWKIAEK